MKCTANKLDGTSCQAYAMHDGQYCFRHSQRTKIQAVEASSNGGKAKRQYHRLGNRMNIKTPEDIEKLMEKAINKLWTGQMPAHNPAGSLGYLAKVFLDAHYRTELEQRLEEVERRLDEAKL